MNDRGFPTSWGYAALAAAYATRRMTGIVTPFLLDSGGVIAVGISDMPPPPADNDNTRF